MFHKGNSHPRMIYDTLASHSLIAPIVWLCYCWDVIPFGIAQLGAFIRKHRPKPTTKSNKRFDNFVILCFLDKLDIMSRELRVIHSRGLLYWPIFFLIWGHGWLNAHHSWYGYNYLATPYSHGRIHVDTYMCMICLQSALILMYRTCNYFHYVR